MDVIRTREITEVFAELEKRYGPKWYEQVAVEIKTEADGEIKAIITPLSFKASLLREKPLKDDISSHISNRESDLLTDVSHKGLEEKLKEYENPKVNVNVSEDEMKAYITIIPGLEREMPTVEEIIKALFDAGVVFGVKNDVIEKVIKERWTYQQILVAEGKEPEEPVNARVDYKFNKSCEGSGHDSIIDGFYCCKEGDVLAQRIPPKEGAPGHTVTGREIPAKLAKDINMQLYAGENTKVEGDKIIGSYRWTGIYQ